MDVSHQRTPLAPPFYETLKCVTVLKLYYISLILRWEDVGCTQQIRCTLVPGVEHHEQSVEQGRLS